MNPHRISKLLLLAICLSLTSACGTFEIGIERTPLATLSDQPGPAHTATRPAILAATSHSNNPTLQADLTAPYPTLTPPPLLQPIDATPVSPAPLYFLTDRPGNQQIWRVETDGTRLTQVTRLPQAVDVYDVSSATGEIAFVSNGALIVSDAMGNNSYELDTVNVNNHKNLSEAVATLAWSPNGSRLAFAGQDGVWLYYSLRDRPVQLAKNPDKVGGMWLASPHAWSPDGSMLLLRMMYENSDGGGIFYAPISNPTVHIANGLYLCYDLIWSRDSRSVYASLGVSTVLCPLPGLLHWDLSSNSSMDLISSKPMTQTRLASFVKAAQEGPDGSLYYFSGNEEVPEGELHYGTLTMFRSDKDGMTNRTALRSDSYSEVHEVLWAEDMSMAVIIDGSNANSTRFGKIIALTSDNKPALVLADWGYALRWGKPE